MEKNNKNILTGIELIAVVLYLIGYVQIAFIIAIVTVGLKLVLEIKKHGKETKINNLLEITILAIMDVALIYFFIGSL